MFDDYDCLPGQSEITANYESDFLDALLDALNDKSCALGGCCYFDKMKGND